MEVKKTMIIFAVMKKILLTLTALLLTMGMYAQSGLLKVTDAVKLFQAKTLAAGKQILEKQGYVYKGISADSYGKDHNWAKNLTLSKQFVPTPLARGTASLVTMSTDGKTVYVYVFNRNVFMQLQGQVKALGYDMGKAVKSASGTLICTKDNQPTITFMTLQQPLPFCMQITE